MPKAILSLFDFQVVVQRYLGALNKHELRRLNADGSNGDKVPQETVDEAVAALKDLHTSLSGICQQNVLAVKATPRRDARPTRRKP